MVALINFDGHVCALADTDTSRHVIMASHRACFCISHVRFIVAPCPVSCSILPTAPALQDLFRIREANGQQRNKKAGPRAGFRIQF